MTAYTQSPAYRPAQIALHWAVVVGIMLQFGLNEQVVRVNEAQRAGAEPLAADINLAWLHVGVGFAILLAVLARLALRLKYGAPPHAPGHAPGHAIGTPPLQARIASATHWALYGLLGLIVATGMATWNGLAPLGDVHFYLGTALFFLIIAHAGAALYNQFVRKDGTMRRMMFARKG